MTEQWIIDDDLIRDKLTGKVIATVHMQIEVEDFLSFIRKMAASPDLLEACQACAAALRSYQFGNDAPDLAENIANNCEQVIARAIGRG